MLDTLYIVVKGSLTASASALSGRHRVLDKDGSRVVDDGDDAPGASPIEASRLEVDADVFFSWSRRARMAPESPYSVQKCSTRNYAFYCNAAYSLEITLSHSM